MVHNLVNFFLLMFGEMLHLDCIPTEYWVPFICSRFEKYGKSYLRNMQQKSVKP